MTENEFLEKIFKTYTLVKKLSENNGASVLRLRHRELGRDVILRCHPTPIAAYPMLLKILHPNLPEIYDVIPLEGSQAVLEEFIDGITVAEVLDGGKYTYSGAKKVIKDICCALSPLHEMDVIHRDIKPENVMITKSGKAMLIDFGAARLHTQGKRTDTVMLGTIGYASPEQLGLTQSDPKTDIYALGVLLNVMLTRHHPSEVFAKGKAGKIVLKCTQIDPNSRFASVQKLIEAL